MSTSARLSDVNGPPYTSLQGKFDPALLQAVDHMGYKHMTPVQEQVFTKLSPLHSDCLVRAKTGTGKTLAFLLPAIQNTLRNSPSKGQVSILVLSPTRELALQIAAEGERLVSRLRPPMEIHTAFGGTPISTPLKRFMSGNPRVLVATPGRLNDYLTDTTVRNKFKELRTLVLDEADRMLDQGFLPAILDILKALPPKTKVQWQGMLFSATLPPTMRQQVLSNVLHPDHIAISTIDENEAPTVSKVPQYSVIIPAVEKTFTALYSILLAEIAATKRGDPKIIVFGTTAKLVALFANLYAPLMNIPTYELHSRLSQSARTRTTAEFRAIKQGIMFASDVIGRGMDFPDVSLVLQVGLPADGDAYTHRVGRTARAGKDGRAIILLTERERFFLKVNPQFPIQPYPAATLTTSEASASNVVSSTLAKIEPDVKQKAYVAYLGFMKTFLKKLQLDAAGLVAMANTFALEGMLTHEVPVMEKKTIGKMGLKGVQGINYGPSGAITTGGTKSAPPPPPPKRSHPPTAATPHKLPQRAKQIHQASMPGPTGGNSDAYYAGMNGGAKGDPRHRQRRRGGHAQK